MSRSLLFKHDYPRPIDRCIDYFGNSQPLPARTSPRSGVRVTILVARRNDREAATSR